MAKPKQMWSRVIIPLMSRFRSTPFRLGDISASQKKMSSVFSLSLTHLSHMKFPTQIPNLYPDWIRQHELLNKATCTKISYKNAQNVHEELVLQGVLKRHGEEVLHNDLNLHKEKILQKVPKLHEE